MWSSQAQRPKSLLRCWFLLAHFPWVQFLETSRWLVTLRAQSPLPTLPMAGPSCLHCLRLPTLPTATHSGALDLTGLSPLSGPFGFFNTDELTHQEVSKYEKYQKHEKFQEHGKYQKYGFPFVCLNRFFYEDARITRANFQVYSWWAVAGKCPGLLRDRGLCKGEGIKEFPTQL